MNAHHDRAKSLFLSAVEIATDEERRAYLDAECDGDETLRGEIEQLLWHHGHMDDFLASTAEVQATFATVPDPDEAAGTRIGSYKLLQQIGEGGMGAVWRAEQEQPVRRQVAVKIVKPGMDSRQIIARFESERQALALMNHLNIARVLDAGSTESGRPYFVMELIHGVPITKFCDDNRLTLRERLELFVPVCQAIQHAHQKGIIHRDIKPSNVLIAAYDGKPVPKVIDFGVAKAVDQRLTERTLYTQYGTVIGTFEYMSPEQAEMSALGVDTRSDIYSLGVLLYELLTGTTPLERQRVRDASYAEIMRWIREEEPPKPSTRLNHSQTQPAIAAVRKTEAKKLSGLVRGELDWIVMKCLEKDRNHRYATANGLALDIESYLHDEPVQACPPSAWYRFRKLARRNKRALTAVGLLAVTLVLAVVGLTVSNFSINREKDRTENALKTAEANLLLARQAVDEMYTQVADQLGSRPYMQPFQRDVLEKALRFYQQFAQRQSGDPALRLETVCAQLRVGQVLYTLGQLRRAKHACDEAIAALEELGAELPADPNRRAWLAASYNLRGNIVGLSGRLRQAAQDLRHALALYGQLAAEQTDEPSHWSNLAANHLALGIVLSDQPGEAEKEVREGIRLYEKLAAKPHSPVRNRVQLIRSYIALGNFLAGVERSQEAERAFLQARDLWHTSEKSRNQINISLPGVDVEFALGKFLAASGRQGEAENAYRRAIAAAERDADHFPDVPGYRQQLAVFSAMLATLLAQSGKPDEAAVFRRSARELFEKLAAESPDGEELCGFLGNAAYYLRDAGDLEAAEQFARKTLTLAAKLAAGSTDLFDRRRVAGSHGSLGVILQRRGLPREAADQFRRGLAIYEQLAAEFPDETEYRFFQARALNFQAIALRTQASELAAAQQYQQRAIALCDKLVAEYPDQPLYRRELVRSHFSLGIVLRLTGRPGEAVQAFQHALDSYRPYSNAVGSTENQGQFASVHNELAWLLATYPHASFSDAGRAIASARRAVELEPENGGFWNTLGLAAYRAGDWKAATAALNKAEELAPGKIQAWNLFFLAMAHWQLGERELARQEHDRAVQWMEKKKLNDEELRRFRAEAEELLQIHYPSPKDAKKNFSP